MIRLEVLCKRYGDGPPAVDALTLEVAAGETCVLVGPSGCGKTTVLKMINRLVEPTSGRVMVDGQDISEVDPVALRRRMGYVIQEGGLFPHRSVYDTVATVPRLLGWDRRRIGERVMELLALVGLDPEEFSGRRPGELSGGQRQRVGVARALAADPPILLLDEPFGAVDPLVRRRLQEEFIDLQGRLGKTALFVTHDIDEALRVGTTVAVLSPGGRVEQHSTPTELLARPETEFSRHFVGHGRLIRWLGLTPVGAALEQIPPNGSSLPELSSDASLAEALGLLLWTDAAGVRVRHQGKAQGVVSLASIHAALRSGGPEGPSE